MKSHELPVLGLVIPCLDEEQMLPIAAQELSTKLDSLVAEKLIAPESRIYFIDDGSTDRTWQIISELSAANRYFHGIKLTRNYGHQYALYAGLMEAEGDILISLDVDLQDDIHVMDPMIIKYGEGNELVYGVRSERSSDTKFKRWTAAAHYRLSGILGVKTLKNHADYRLMSRRAIDLLAAYRETNIYLRGMIPMLGLKSAVVYYKRANRREGTSKYGLADMLNLSAQGITSLSIMPLRIISFIGFLVFFVSFCLGVWALYAALTGNSEAIAGWASTVIPIYLLGGLQLLAIGVAGEYIGKTYMEVKRRPLYQIETTTEN